MTAKKRARKVREPKPDEISVLRAELGALARHLGELIETRPSKNAIEEVRRECAKEFEKLQLRITEAFDAKPLTYLDSQRVASLHNRVNSLNEILTVDARQREIFQSRIQALEAVRDVHRGWIRAFAGLGFWARFRWLLFGDCRFLSMKTPEETRDFYLRGKKVDDPVKDFFQPKEGEE